LKDSENPSPVWFDKDPGTDYVRWTNTYDYVYYDNAARKYAVLNPGANNYFEANTRSGRMNCLTLISLVG